jgi:hypothetical protein
MKDPSLWETVEHKAQGVVVQEKMQSKMLQMDSAESSAQEGTQRQCIPGIGRSAVLRWPGQPVVVQKTRKTTPTSAMEPRLFTVALTNCYEVKLVRRNIGKY